MRTRHTVIVGKLEVVKMRRQEIFERFLSPGGGRQLHSTVLLTDQNVQVVIWSETFSHTNTIRTPTHKQEPAENFFFLNLLFCL